MTSVQGRAAEQVLVALEYVQGKRRVERVMEAASALLDRYAAQADATARMTLAFELIRRNFSAQTWLRHGSTELGTPLPAAAEDSEVFELTLAAGDGVSGVFRARYTADNPLMLSPAEWRSALRLLVGIAAVATGGHAT